MAVVHIPVRTQQLIGSLQSTDLHQLCHDDPFGHSVLARIQRDAMDIEVNHPLLSGIEYLQTRSREGLLWDRSTGRIHELMPPFSDEQ